MPGLQDDLGGGPADQTVRFGVDGAEYESDLSTTTPRRSAASSRRSPSLHLALGGPAGPFHAGRAGQGNNWACGNDVAACRACRLHNGEEPGPVRLMPQTTAILPGGIP